MEYINIIKTEIVKNEFDTFWEEMPALVTDTICKPVVVIVNSCTEGSAEDAQLQKMLSGSKLDAGQYNIIRLAKDQKIAWHKLRERYDPRIIFLIGVSPLQLGISAYMILNAPNNFNDRIWLPTVDINELEQHKDVKLNLWNNGMKPVFIDKKFGVL